MFAVRLLPMAFVLGFYVSSAVAQEAPVAAPAAVPAVAAPAPAGPAVTVPVPPPEQAAPAPQYAAPALGAPLAPVGQPAYGPDRRSELAAVDQRLSELRLQRPSLGGPITLIAVGGGVAIAGAYVALLSWLVDAADDGLYCDDYGDDYDCHSKDNRRLMRGMALMSLAGLGTAIGGFVWLSKHLKARRELKPEINALKIRRNYLLQTLHYGLNVEQGRYGLSVGASF